MTASGHQEDRLVGEVIDGAYRLTRWICQGGMGTVYEGLQLRLNRRVAIKVMVPELAANPEALARFRREVEVTSQLANPHIIQVLDFGTTASGQPYMVMEYLEGEDLEQRLRRTQRLPLPAVVDVIKQVASALAVPHSKGIVHRDLKPANVFLLPLEGAPDFVKILDFGISKVRTARTKLTRVATVVGTPNYVSPEQATGRGDDVDHRSDQWALGCVTWQMLSGAVPFAAGDDINKVLHKIVREDPPSLIQQVPDLPIEVEHVLRRALAKQQAERFPTVLAFSRALNAAAATGLGALAAMPAVTPAPVVRPETRPPRRQSPTAPVLVMLALVMGAAVYCGATHYLNPTPATPAAKEPESRSAAQKHISAPHSGTRRTP